MPEKNEMLTYKGLPLVRCNNELYFGNPDDSHVIFMQILSTEEKDGIETIGKVHVQLLSNNTSLPAKARVLKQGERTGLYGALDIGYIWLQRALSEQ